MKPLKKENTHHAWFYLTTLLLALSGSTGCSGEHQVCTIDYDEEQQAIVRCPRQSPVTLQGVDRSSNLESCVYQDIEHHILCGERRFDAMTGEELVEDVSDDMLGSLPDMGLDLNQGDMEEDVTDMEDVGSFGSTGFASASRTHATFICTLLAQDVVCPDGLTVTLPDAFDGENTRCTSRMIKGLGRRIMCVTSQNGEDTYHMYVPDGEESKPACFIDGEEVSCEDGSVYTLDSLQHEDGRKVESCEMPELQVNATPEEFALCMEELDACQEVLCDLSSDPSCTDVVCELSSECEARLTPTVICNGERVQRVQEFKACTPKEGGFWIASEEHVARLKALKCEEIWGDVVIAPDEFTQERADLMWTRALEGVRIIDGSLIIERTTLKPQDVSDWDVVLNNLSLHAVGGDVKFHDQVGIQYLDWPSTWVFVGGQVQLSSLQEVKRITLEVPDRSSPRVIMADLTLQGNPVLEKVRFERTTVKGSLGLAGNVSFQGCPLYNAIQWAYEFAGGLVLIQGDLESKEPPESCIFGG